MVVEAMRTFVSANRQWIRHVLPGIRVLTHMGLKATTDAERIAVAHVFEIGVAGDPSDYCDKELNRLCDATLPRMGLASEATEARVAVLRVMASAMGWGSKGKYNFLSNVRLDVACSAAAAMFARGGEGVCAAAFSALVAACRWKAPPSPAMRV